MGVLLLRTPSTSYRAAAIAPAVGTRPISPTPFTPYGERGWGTSTIIVSTSGMSLARRIPRLRRVCFVGRANSSAQGDKPDLKREPLGEKEIDGRHVVGYRLTGRGQVNSFWGDPKTGLPVLIEQTMAMFPDAKTTMSDFVFNVEMDESLFSVEPPAGYEVMNGAHDGPLPSDGEGPG